MILRWLLALVVLAFLAIQFVPVDRSNPPVKAAFAAPPEVQPILERSCYDCHSNQTRWPWYSRVAPVSWMVTRHVREGREHLNFSEWEAGAEAGEVAKEAWKEVEAGKMPLPSYLLSHPSARLSQADRDALKNWAAKAAAESAPEGSPAGTARTEKAEHKEREEHHGEGHHE